MNITKILLLGGGLQALSFGESLSGYDDYELSVVSDEFDVRVCKFFKKRYSLSPRGLSETVNDILSSDPYHIIVPMGDVPASYLSRHKKQLKADYGVECAVPDYDALSIAEDKSKLMSFCLANGFPCPRTVRIDAGDIEDAVRIVGFPALIKPDFSVGARGITKVNSNRELKQVFPDIHREYGPCTLQEFIENHDYYFNVMLYRNADSKCLAYTITRIYRMYPVKGGSSSCCITVDDEKLLGICRSVLDRLNWTGMADFDVLQRRDTLEYKIIEINPRVPASLRASFISGVNFPKIIVDDALGRKTISATYNSGKILRYMGLDLLWLLRSPERFRRIKEWLHFYDENIYYQDIIMNDKSTWYSWLVEGACKLLNRNRVSCMRGGVEISFSDVISSFQLKAA